MRKLAIPLLHYNASLAGTVYLQLVFWGSLSTFFISLDLLATALGDSVLIPCTILLLLASLLALSCICFHQINVRRRLILKDNVLWQASVRRPVYIAVRLVISTVLLWLISSGWNLVTAARQPTCLPENPGLQLWQVGSSCIAQRAGTALSIVNLLSACALFVHMATSRDPFESHLFGQIRRRSASIIPYKYDAKPDEEGLGSRKTSTASNDFEKPLPKTPTVEARPLTPIGGGPIGLGIFTPSDLSVQPPSSSPSGHAFPLRPSLSRFHHNNQSSANLPGFTPPSPMRRPSPALAADSAWRALHPPANHFRHVSDLSLPAGSRSPLSRRYSGISPSPGSPSLGLRSHSRTPSAHSASYSRGHSHSRSLPHVAMASASRSSSSGGSPHRRGASVSAAGNEGLSHSTSDPNAIIFAHLAAEMEVARKLERKLLEVGQKVEMGKVSGDSSGSGSSSHGATSSQESYVRAESSVPSAGAGNGDGSAGSESGGTELSVHTASSGVLGKTPSTATTPLRIPRPAPLRRDSSLFAEAEWHVLMGKERPGKRDMFF